MKKKPAKQAAPKKNLATPKTKTSAGQEEDCPPGLEFFAQAQHLSQMEQIALVSPELASAFTGKEGEQKQDAFAGLVWGMGLDMGVQLPDWAKAASEIVWRALGLNILNNLSTDPTAVGKIVELAGMMPPKNNPTSADRAAGNLIGLLRTEFANLSITEQEEYVQGRKAVSNLKERLGRNFLSERLMAFFCIATRWREVEKLGSRNKVFLWLKDQTTSEGKLLFASQTGWGEIKDWLAEINIPKGKPGAPKKIRTLAKSENPDYSKKR